MTVLRTGTKLYKIAQRCTVLRQQRGDTRWSTADRLRIDEFYEWLGERLVEEQA